MIRTESGPTGISNIHDRTQAMTLYTRVFFRSISADKFARIIEDARTLGQHWLVERLYADKVIDSIVKKVLSRIDKMYYGSDQIDDYTHDATVVLMQIARQGKFDLSKSAGEIASYTCLWIEQRVKRVAKKDQRWQFSLSETESGSGAPAGDIEALYAVDRGFCEMENYYNESAVMEEQGATERETSAINLLYVPELPKKNRVATYAMRKKNSYIYSLFNSKKTAGLRG